MECQFLWYGTDSRHSRESVRLDGMHAATCEIVNVTATAASPSKTCSSSSRAPAAQGQRRRCGNGGTNTSWEVRGPRAQLSGPPSRALSRPETKAALRARRPVL